MKKEPRIREIKEVVVDVVATDDGYYKSRIIKTGEKFTYDGVTKDGKLPLWVKAVGAIKVKGEEKKPVAKKVKKEEEKVESPISDLV